MSKSKAELIEQRFVVGIDWRRSVQRGNLRKEALQRGRKHHANWYGIFGDHTYGLASLRSKPAKGEHWYALASGFAAMCGYGYGFAAIRLNDGRIWLCSATDGVPNAGYDQIVRDEASAASRLRQFTGTLDAGSSCEVWTNAASLVQTSQGLPLHPTDLADIMAAAQDQAPMQPVGTTVPAPVLAVLGMGILAFASYKGWDYWQLQQRLRAQAQADAAAYVNPVAAWTQAYESLASGEVIVGSQGLRSLREALAALPTSIAGWRLGMVECQASVQDWLCTLDYERSTRVGLDPTNAGFERLRPPQWQSVQFPSVNQVRVHWTVPSLGQPLGLQGLRSVQQQQIEGISALQQVLRGFAGHEMAAYEEIVPDAPLDGEGQPIPRPEELTLAIRKASLSLNGPLRSVDVLVDADIPVAWRSLRLHIEPIPTDWQFEGRTDLLESLLKATVTGDVYASR